MIKNLQWYQLIILVLNFSVFEVLAKNDNVLIVVSYDAFRNEYFNRNVTDYMNSLRFSNTYTDYMRNVFPTKTYPNHVSIATGGN
jgi:predicted AlkP superfamily pyrophosphatase or phosphodiesterase